MSYLKLVLAVSGVLAAAGPVGAQATLDAPPNLSHGWVAVPGGIQFNLLHRFSLGPAPSRKLQNAPTISLALGVTSWLSAGLNYASASEVVLAYPNEWELYARIAPWSQDGGGPFDLFLQGGYNVATASVDGQLLLARRVGRVRLLAGAGVLEDALRTGRTRATLAAGATVRVRGQLGLAGDVSTFADRDGEEIAWSAGFNLGIAHTPHTLSVHATNVASRTLQGIAEGTVQTRYGFEYTIPISLGRFFSRPAAGRSGAAYRGAGRPSPAEDSRQEKRVVVDIRSLRYARGRIEIDAGTTVVWRNRDPLAHTVTGDSAAVDSGEIGPDKDWSHTFTTAGTFSYHCTPHPHMKATVVVRPSSASKEKS